MIWTAIYFPTPGNLATAIVLGNLRAPHQPAAMLRANAKWPDRELRQISVRPKRAARDLMAGR